MRATATEATGSFRATRTSGRAGAFRSVPRPTTVLVGARARRDGAVRCERPSAPARRWAPGPAPYAVEVSDLLDPGTDARDDGSADADEFPVEAGVDHAKVVGLVAFAVFMAVLVALAAQSRFDGEAADSVDVGFMQDMISHHEQAIQMGLLGVENVGDEGVRHFAQETIVAQQWEIGYMTALLEDWGFGTGDADRDTMVWMDMPTRWRTCGHGERGRDGRLRPG